MNTPRATRIAQSAAAVAASGDGILADLAAATGNQIALRWFAQFDSATGRILATSSIEERLMRQRVGSVLTQWGITIAVQDAGSTAAGGAVVDGGF